MPRVQTPDSCLSGMNVCLPVCHAIHLAWDAVLTTGVVQVAQKTARPPRASAAAAKMGRRKSKVQRLPPSERTVVGSKVVIFDPPPPRASFSRRAPVAQNVPTALRLAEAIAPAPSAEFSAMRVSPRRSGPRVDLDDDTLRKVLRHAGPVATLAAARVCRRWRRVALAILDETSHVDLSAFARRFVLSDLTYSSLLRTADSFPNMARLSLRNFPHTDVLPNVAGFVMTHLRSATLHEADFSGLEFSGADLVALLDGCPNLSALQLSGTPSVKAGVLQTLVGSLQGSVMRPERTLELVDVSSCDGVDHAGLIHLLTRGRVREVKAAFCRNARALGGASMSPLTVERLNLHGCINLTQFAFRAGSLRDLNVSQCPSLYALHLQPSAPNTPLELRTLNLALCSLLRDVSFGEYGGTAPPFPLSKLEELLLSGARSLSAAVISKSFGICRAVCVMPKLRRLEVIGCQIEELRIRGYTDLERVNCSGCPHLNIVEISDSWKIMYVNLSSRRSAMTRVQIVIPSMAKVLGLRKSWSWESTDATQTVNYGP